MVSGCFAVGRQVRGELHRYDVQSRAFIPYLPQVPDGFLLDYSRDGRWITYVAYTDLTLWKCAADGSQRFQLTFPPTQADSPRWSPDGKRIAFTDLASDKILVISAEGGSPEELAPTFDHFNDTAWSGDGNSLAFGADGAIHIVDLKTHKVSKLAGSDGIFYPRWSPDGRYIEGVSKSKEMLFDFKTHEWSTIIIQIVQYPTWSRDGKYLYFNVLSGDDWSVYRVRVADRKLERVASLKGIETLDSLHGWVGLTPDNSLLLVRDTGGQEIYALDWEAP